MVGPSSSHVAAASIIGKIIRYMLNEAAVGVIVEFPHDSSLVTTYHSQGTDMGFACGLIGMDPGNPDTSRELELVKSFIPLTFRIINKTAFHPNDYKIRVQYVNHEYIIRAVSTGGGMIEIRKLCGFPVCIHGDCYELITLCDRAVSDVIGIGNLFPLVFSTY